MRQIFIVVPSLHPAGPVKGAVALANALSERRSVTLVSLKRGPGVDAFVEPKVRLVTLAHFSWYRKITTYRSLLKQAGGRSGAASISFCLSADVVNITCRQSAVTLSSVRGNLPVNYSMDYGPLGRAVAIIHLCLLRWLDHTVAMSESMGDQIARYTGSKPPVIGNFIDEASLAKYRRTGPRVGPYRFVFVGSLSSRKRPDLILYAAAALKREGLSFHLDIVGDGPLRTNLGQLLNELHVTGVVTLHGNLAEPYPIIAGADCLVLPSLSEGISRAALEALYLGVPCLLRDVDGNAEVIVPGTNGLLFANDRSLAAAMSTIARWSRDVVTGTHDLLPAAFRQDNNAQLYLALVES